MEVVSRSIEISAREIFKKKKDTKGCSPLHFAFCSDASSIEAISILIETAGKDLVMNESRY